LNLLSAKRYPLQAAIHGVSHITGGAFYDKIARILPDNLSLRIDKSSWVVPKIFRLIQSKGNIADKEMYHTFNMGVGMVLIVAPASANTIISKLTQFKLRAWVIGEVVRGKKEVEIA
jgi:phosphoribosylformylglycinamidine cyclo-ligase